MGKAEIKIDADLLEQAQAAGLQPERLAEEAIRRALPKPTDAEIRARAAKWAAENATAIRAHEEQIEKFGVFGEDLRTW